MATSEMRFVLTVEDFAGAVAFFRDGLGMPQLAEFANDGGRGVLLDGGRATLEVFDAAQAAAIDQIEVGRRVAGQVRIAFEVPDSESAARRLLEFGGETVGGPVTTPWGDRNVRVAGPEALQLTLFTPWQS